MDIDFKSEFNTHNVMDRLLTRLSRNPNVTSLGQAPPRPDKIQGAVATYWVTTPSGTIWIVATQKLGKDHHISKPSHILVGTYEGPYQASRFRTLFAVPMIRNGDQTVEANIEAIINDFFKGGKKT